MESIPITNEAQGDPESIKEKVLETGACLAQNLDPLKRACAHLNAFHVYVNEPTRASEANHYCAHVNEDVRQCVLYDSPGPNARLIGVEYMVSPRIYETLEPEERKLWHSHVFEVKSGMLIMPAPAGVPHAVWQKAENAEMEEVVHLYGKVFQLWQVDRGDKVPLGMPELMTSFTSHDQTDFDKLVSERDKRFGVSSQQKADSRKYIQEPEVHPDADHVWNKQTHASG